MGRQSDIIKKLRGNLTQSQFAEKLGVDRTRISKYENEKHDLPLGRFLEWCEKLGVEELKIN